MVEFRTSLLVAVGIAQEVMIAVQLQQIQSTFCLGLSQQLAVVVRLVARSWLLAEVGRMSQRHKQS
jgi:hypothetical protein